MLFRDMQRLGEKEEGGCGAKLSVPFIFLSYFFFFNYFVELPKNF